MFSERANIKCCFVLLFYDPVAVLGLDVGRSLDVHVDGFCVDYYNCKLHHCLSGKILEFIILHLYLSKIKHGSKE